jgi:hypothetical protein
MEPLNIGIDLCISENRQGELQYYGWTGITHELLIQTVASEAVQAIRRLTRLEEVLQRLRAGEGIDITPRATPSQRKRTKP